MAPAPIENLLNVHPKVEMSLVSGAGQPAAFGLLVLAEHLRPQLADPAVRAEVERELGQLLVDVNAALALHQRLRMLVVAPEPWSIENGMLTPTMKIRRPRIEAAVADQVQRWYAQPGSVFWA